MHETKDFKNGLKIMVDNQPYSIEEFQHVKPGKGNQFTRTILKNLLNGGKLERTFKSGEKFDVPDIVYQEMSFLYKDDSGYNFMNPSSFEQMSLNDQVVGKGANFLTENLSVQVCIYNDRAVGIEVPKSVNLKVAKTDPGFKGNTVSGTTKPATLETGYVVQVPLHINEGDVLRVNTADGAYVERVSIR